MPVMLERWNDDKMDALATKVDALATKVDVLAVKVDGVEVKLGEQGQELRELQRDTKAGFERLDDRFDRLQRAAIQAAVGLASSIVLGFATVIAAVLLAG
jgi:hypothetical protein